MTKTEQAIREQLRDQAAIKAMQAILAGSAWSVTKPSEVAEKAYDYANALVAERDKQP